MNGGVSYTPAETEALTREGIWAPGKANDMHGCCRQ